MIKRDGRIVAEFAVEPVAVAQPPFAARAEALAAILHAFPRHRAPAVVLSVLVLQNLVPLLGGLVVDAFTLIVIGFHVRYLRSLLPNGGRKKRSVTGQTEWELTRFVRPATLVDWFLIHL